MTTTPDFRALSADLLVAIQLYTGLRHPAASEMSSVEITGKLMDTMAATATALATPPPEPGESIEELIAGCKPLDPAMAKMLIPDARWRLFGEDDSLPTPPEPPTQAGEVA